MATFDFHSTLSAILGPPRILINCEGDPYLYRWYLFRSDAIGVFIHRFERSDEDRALHDHPWSFFVLPIWRGYIEHSESGSRRVWPIIGARFRSSTYRHRVELIDGKPAWSIFIRFTRTREWGFWPGGKFIPWKDWWSDKCE